MDTDKAFNADNNQYHLQFFNEIANRSGVDVNTIVHNAFTNILQQRDTYAERVRDTALHLIDNSIRNTLTSRIKVVIPVMLDSVLQERLKLMFSKFDVTFTNANVESHPYAHALRILEYYSCLFHARYFERKLSPGYQFIVKDVGSNISMILNHEFDNICMCNPILSVKDSFRCSNSQLYLKRLNLDVLTTKQRIIYDAMLSNPAYICNKLSQNCITTAETLLFVQSVYDMSITNIADAMESSKALDGYGSFIWRSDMLLCRKVYFENLRLYVRLEYRNIPTPTGLDEKRIMKYFPRSLIDKFKGDNASKRLCYVFTFLNDSSAEYVHDAVLYLEFCFSQYLVSSTKQSHYFMEFLHNVDGIQFFKILRLNHSYCPSGYVYRPFVISDDETLCIKYYVWQHADRLVDSMIPVYLRVPVTLWDRCYSYTSALPDGKFTIHTVIQAAQQYNLRTIFGGFSVTSRQKIRSREAVLLAQAVYLQVWKDRYNDSQVMKCLQSDESANRNYQHESVFYRIYKSLTKSTTLLDDFDQTLKYYLFKFLVKLQPEMRSKFKLDVVDGLDYDITILSVPQFVNESISVVLSELSNDKMLFNRTMHELSEVTDVVNAGKLVDYQPYTVSKCDLIDYNMIDNPGNNDCFYFSLIECLKLSMLPSDLRKVLLNSKTLDILPDDRLVEVKRSLIDKPATVDVFYFCALHFNITICMHIEALDVIWKFNDGCTDSIHIYRTGDLNFGHCLALVPVVENIGLLIEHSTDLSYCDALTLYNNSIDVYCKSTLSIRRDASCRAFRYQNIPLTKFITKSSMKLAELDYDLNLFVDCQNVLIFGNDDGGFPLYIDSVCLPDKIYHITQSNELAINNYFVHPDSLSVDYTDIESICRLNYYFTETNTLYDVVLVSIFKKSLSIDINYKSLINLLLPLSLVMHSSSKLLIFVNDFTPNFSSYIAILSKLFDVVELKICSLSRPDSNEYVIYCSGTKVSTELFTILHTKFMNDDYDLDITYDVLTSAELKLASVVYYYATMARLLEVCVINKRANFNRDGHDLRNFTKNLYSKLRLSSAGVYKYVEKGVDVVQSIFMDYYYRKHHDLVLYLSRIKFLSVNFNAHDGNFTGLDKHLEVILRNIGIIGVYNYLYDSTRKDYGNSYRLLYSLYEHYNLINRSAFKLLDMRSKFLKLHYDNILDVCGAPGGFLQVLRDFYPTSRIDTFSLHKHDYKVKLDVNYFEHNVFDADLSFLSNKYQLILCDGANSVSYKDESIFIAEFKLAMSKLDKGGDLIIKHSNLFMLRSSTISKFCSVFSYIDVYKPLFSPCTNTEVYIICRNFGGPFVQLNKCKLSNFVTALNDRYKEIKGYSVSYYGIDELRHMIADLEFKTVKPSVIHIPIIHSFKFKLFSALDCKECGRKICYTKLGIYICDCKRVYIFDGVNVRYRSRFTSVNSRHIIAFMKLNKDYEIISINSKVCLGKGNLDTVDTIVNTVLEPLIDDDYPLRDYLTSDVVPLNTNAKTTDILYNSFLEQVKIWGVAKDAMIDNLKRAWSLLTVSLVDPRDPAKGLFESVKTHFNNWTPGAISVNYKNRWLLDNDALDTYTYCYSKNGFTSYPTVEDLFIVHKDLDSFLDPMFLDQYKNYKFSISPNLVINYIQGVPGCGKSQTIVSGYRPGDLVLCLTKNCRNQLLSRLQVIYPNINVDCVMTVASALLNYNRSKVNTVWIDEARMLHAGSIAIICSITQCSIMNCLGDVNQIPYICRQSYIPIYSDLTKYIKPSEIKNISYRIPLDIAKLFSPLYQSTLAHNVLTTSIVKNSRHKIVIKSIEDLSFKINDVVIVFTQAEKLMLLRRFPDAFVATVNEYQGDQAPIINLVRLNDKLEHNLFKRDDFILVALTRHTQRINYYTLLPNDKISTYFEEMYSDAELNDYRVTVPTAGYILFNTVDLYRPLYLQNFRYSSYINCNVVISSKLIKNRIVLIPTYSGNVTDLKKNLFNLLYCYVGLNIFVKYSKNFYYDPDLFYSILDDLAKILNIRFYTDYEKPFNNLASDIAIRNMSNYVQSVVPVKLDYIVDSDFIKNSNVANVTLTHVYFTELSDKILYSYKSLLKSYNIVINDYKALSPIVIQNKSRLCANKTVAIKEINVKSIEKIINVYHKSHSFELLKYNLQSFYDDVFPTNSSHNVLFDHIIVGNSDIVLFPDAFVYNDAKLRLVNTKSYDNLRPVLNTSMRPSRSRSGIEILLAAIKRNMSVFGSFQLTNYSVMIDAVYHLLYNNLFNDDKDYLLSSFKENPIICDATSVDSWLTTQPSTIAGMLKDLSYMEIPWNCYDFDIKPSAKPDLSFLAPYNYTALQTIVSSCKDLNVFLCPLFKQATLRLLSLLPDNVIIFTNMSPEDLCNILNRDFNFQGNLFLHEVDISKFDKSHILFHLLLECFLMEILGFEKRLVRMWFWMHYFTIAFNRSADMKFYFMFQRKSGDPSTFIFNTFILLCVLVCMYNLKKCFLVLLAGDDSLIANKKKLKDRSLDIGRFFNFDCKFYNNYMYAYFCSKFLLYIDSRWYFVPDPVKVVTKLGRSDLINDCHVELYRVSCADLLKSYDRLEIVDALTLAVNDRYFTSFTSLFWLLYSITVIIKDPNYFRRLWYHLPTDIISDQYFSKIPDI